MIEILILYTIQKREKTIYSIRKEIIEIFGTFTKPSIGTIYPALKRLLKEGAVEVYEKISEGGKKSTYYSSTKKGLECFKKYFFNTGSENPSLFYTHLQARLGTMSLLNEDERKNFISENLRKIDLYKIEIEKKLNDEYLELDYYQKQLLNRTLKEVQNLETYMKELKTN